MLERIKIDRSFVLIVRRVILNFIKDILYIAYEIFGRREAEGLLLGSLLFGVWVAIYPGVSMAAASDNQEEAIEEAESLESSERWLSVLDELDYSLRVLAFGTDQKPADSTQNPQNNFFRLPRYLAEIELRPDVFINLKRLDMSVKPRLNIKWRKWDEGVRSGDSKIVDDWFINEWLARLRLTGNLFVSYGRENLQWGPSFLISPSNPFFRDNGRNNPKREVAGLDFARLVWLPTDSWTFSLIANLGEGQQEFRLDEFEKIYALKLDYVGQEAYTGLILSHREGDRTRLGGFGGWTATDALLLYAEGAAEKGTRALYPEAANNPFGLSMEPSADDSNSVEGTFLLGGAYTLEVGPTLTLEYIYNGPGYDSDQARAYYRLREDAADAFDAPGLIGGLSRLTLSQTADPFLRLLRRNYLMFQYKHNDIWDALDLTLRWTQNLDDSSGQFLSIAEYFLSDHIEFYSIATVNSGSEDTEFGTVLDHQVIVGLEYTF